VPEVRKGQGDMRVSQDVFRERFRERFYDPAFGAASADVDRLADIAWDPAQAKELELCGWPYPRHLQGRAYSVVVHGDAAGAQTLRRSLSDWLADLQLATSHDALDEDTAIHEEVRNAARAVIGKVRELRGGKRFDEGELADPRPK
jgi:hypothetical protein